MDGQIHFLAHIAYQMRKDAIEMTTHAGSGHVTSALSAADIMAVLFFKVMRFDPDNFDNPLNDRFILSKGHAAPILYAVWHRLNKISKQELMGYRSFTSDLEGHPTFRFAYAEAATGSLGIGLSIGLGEALLAQRQKRDYRVYVLMGDSEVSEGSVWEAAQLASFYNVTNLIGIIDCNRLGQSTLTMEAIKGNEADRFADMFRAFGWQAHCVDGHDIVELMRVFSTIHNASKPTVIIARTKKGYGVSSIEDKEGFHGQPIAKEQEATALELLAQRFPKAAQYIDDYVWYPSVPLVPQSMSPVTPADTHITLPPMTYSAGDSIPTRKAFGIALRALGAVCQQVVSLDAEVKNSTYAELFEQAYPHRFFQCFIAEQNMVSMAVGMQARGALPFVSTFGAFMTRAHDQIRMAAIGNAPIRFVGSHAGVSIGQDGPSQMALEDIAMMCAIPESVVLYPSDAMSTYALVQEMARYNQGISYLRTTRMGTPLLYDAQELFPIGGCKVIKQSDKDRLVVIAAGITLHEALKAYELLKKDGVLIAVIDLYCIKPLDIKTIQQIVHKAHRRVVTVEDHYSEGGLGQIVSAALCNDDVTIDCLAVTQLPRSGKPEELLAFHEIDAQAIMKRVYTMIEK